MLGLIRKMFLELLRFYESLVSERIKYAYLNNQPCKARPAVFQC